MATHSTGRQPTLCLGRRGGGMLSPGDAGGRHFEAATPPRTASFRRDTAAVVAQGRPRAFDLRGDGRGG